MMHPELLPLGSGERKTRPKVKVVGIGGAGCNAVASSCFESVGICTAAEHFKRLHTNRTILLSEEQLLFMRDTAPQMIASIDYDWKVRVRETIGEADMIFLFTGLGGETGSFVTPIVSQICRKLCRMVVASIALPFSVEGLQRKKVATVGLSNLLGTSDMAITYPNDSLLKIAPNLPIMSAFSVMDRWMMIPPAEIEKVITVEDIHVLRTSFASAKHARFGIGVGEGDEKELKAVDEAFKSPWFDFDLSKVGVAMVIASASDVDESTVRKVVGDVSYRLPNAKVAYAGSSDQSLGDKLKVALLLGKVGNHA